jgi:hypothetical protein
MSARRAHVLLPEDLLREIDAIVGPRGRSAFLVETARNEVRRQKLLRFLESKEPAWKDQDHPELAGGAADWVRNLRDESESRGRVSSGPASPSRPSSGRYKTKGRGKAR